MRRSGDGHHNARAAEDLNVVDGFQQPVVDSRVLSYLERTDDQHNAIVEELAARYAKGLDLWTGEPLDAATREELALDTAKDRGGLIKPTRVKHTRYKAGETYGLLTLVRATDDPRKWECSCACGSTPNKMYWVGSVVHGNTTACGCRRWTRESNNAKS
jgi:hypothetical protein